MAFQIIHIPDLPVASSVVGTDKYIVETAAGTKSVTQSVVDSYGANLYLRKNVNDVTTGSITASSFIASSSKKFKDKIALISNNDLLKTLHLNPVSYSLINQTNEGRRDIGLIAEDVEVLFPELVARDPNGNLGIDYSRLSVCLLGVVKDLSSRLSALETK